MTPRDPADLATVILAEESARAEQRRTPDAIVLPDDLLPGVGDARLGLGAALRTGGRSLLVVLFLIAVVEEFDRTAMALLAPEIQKTLDVSDAVLGAIGAAAGVLFVLGAVPIAYLADRISRVRIVAVATGAWAAVVLATATVTNAFWLFITRMGSGLGQSNTLPVHNALLADGYPIQARGRVFALHALGGPVGLVLAPVAIGGIAELAGGSEGWRWAFVAIAIPGALLAIVSLRLREPARGANEQEAVLGEVLSPSTDELPIPLNAAFARLQKIRTFYFLLVGVGALGFAFFSIPLFFNLFLEEHYDLGALDRGLVNSAVVLPALVAIPLAGARNDQLFRQSPARSLVLCGGLIAAFGVVFSIGLYLPSLVALIIVSGLGMTMSRAAFTVLTPIVASIVPYRLRSQGYALLGIYIFLFGSFFGAVLTGLLSDELGERAALAIVVIPSTLIGGALIAYGARYIRTDISVAVEELLEERAERERMAEPDALVPALQIRNLDFSYGRVQVLFDVSLEVRRGETLALLGTNGAGKSTLLRVVSGLGIPSRGVVRHHGRTLTFVDPTRRVDLGIVQVAGGRAVFPPLTVRENLRVGAFTCDSSAIDDRISEVLDLFPTLRTQLDRDAGTLSGGQQQMLGLAKALLLHPDVLLIDELSLGLAPVVVEELLGVVTTLQSRGVTLVIVEQSVNLALELADRAVFMEKGEVRFDGPARDLLERDDLVRAVFLGRES